MLNRLSPKDRPYCFHDESCDGNHLRLWQSNKNEAVRDGKCVCKEGYMRESEDHQRMKYKEGEKCVSAGPCSSLRRPLSVVFIVDASQSIGADSWPSVVNFLKSGARLIPNQVDVGFVKFSTSVSFSSWLPRKWSQKEFERIVPTSYDAGYTNR